MKRLLTLIIIIIACMMMVVAANPAIILVNDNGYVTFGDNEIATSLSMEGGKDKELLYIENDEFIYSSLGRYYMAESNTTIDMSYPMYINDGRTLSFLNHNFWLVSDRFDIVESYNGLYINDGYTFNADLTQADDEDFILVALENGLHMNSQDAIFKNPMGEFLIPSNSIVNFTNEAIRFYYYDEGILRFDSIGQTFDATIQIGDNIYSYRDFLEALGLLDELIDNTENNEDTEDEKQEIEDLLDGNPTNNTGDSDESEGGPDGESSGDGESESGNEGNESNDSADGGDPENKPDDEDDELEDSTSPEGGDQTDPAPGEGEGEDNDGEDGTDGEDGDSGDDLNPEEPGEGEEGEGGEGVPPPYKTPVVSLSGFEPWTYSISADLGIEDQSAAIRRGISVAVYREIRGDKVQVGTQDGYKVYDKNEGVGKSTALRRTYNSAADIVLSTIQPDTTVYLQFTYSYNAERTDGSGTVYYERVTEMSDFYEVTTLSIEEGNLTELVVSYEDVFAAYSNRFELTNLTLKNSSAYDPEDTSYENFKLNTLPYVSRLGLNFDGLADDVFITSSVLKKAQAEGGTSFTSLAGILSSNGIHDYSIYAVDRYGNKLPLRVENTPYTSFKGDVTTSKLQPTVTVEEVENVTDKLTLEFTVEDVDNALYGTGGINNSLDIYVENFLGGLTYLSGTIKDGSNEIPFGEDTPLGMLELTNPSHGKKYVVTFDSLAFARSYKFYVVGDYHVQPDGITSPMLPVKTDQVLKTEQVYTASITSGSLILDSKVYNTTDTTAEFGLTFTEESTIEIFPLIDEYRIDIYNNTKNLHVADIVLSEKVLSDIYMGDLGYEYNEETGTIVIGEQEGFVIELKGVKEQFVGVSLWDAIQVRPTGVEGEYFTPVEMVFTANTGVLETSSEHTYNFEAVVIKSGVEYEIPKKVSNDTFRTKKLSPYLVEGFDVFLAKDVFELIDFGVIDKDGTVLKDGEILIEICIGDAVLDVKKIQTNQPLQNIRFEGLTPGLYYDVRIRASEYNNDIGFANYKTYHLLEEFQIQAGSDISADITLNKLEYNFKSDDTYELVLNVTGEEIKTGIENTANGTITDDLEKWNIFTGNIYISKFYDIESLTTSTDINTLQIEMPAYYAPSISDTVYGEERVYFYDASRSLISYSTVYTTGGGSLVAMIPDNAKYMKIVISDRAAMEQWGFEVYGFNIDVDKDKVMDIASNHTGDITLTNHGEEYQILDGKGVHNTSTGELVNYSSQRTIYMMPVKPGDVYFSNTSSNSTWNIMYYNSQKQYVGHSTLANRNTYFEVPEDVYYISVSYYRTHHIKWFTINSDPIENGYHIDADIDVLDKKGFLLDNDGNSTVKVRVLRSDILVDPDFTYDPTSSSNEAELVEEFAVSLTHTLEEGYTAALNYVRDNYVPNSSYQISVVGIYSGSEIVLDSEIFNTMGSYETIATKEDFDKILENPHGNFLVTEDITLDRDYDFTLFGTIDFNGHVITKTGSSRLFAGIGDTGVIKNLVYNNVSATPTGIVTSNYGTVENIFIKIENEFRPGYSGAFAQNHYGILKNFVIEFNRDVVFTDVNEEMGYLVRYAFGGEIENGYVYTNDGADMVMDISPVSNRVGGAMAQVWAGAEIKNIYTAFDVYKPEEVAVDSAYIFTPLNYSTNIENIYHIGDTYILHNDEKTPQRETKTRMIRNVYGLNQSENIWMLSQYEYSPYNSYDDVNYANLTLLHDVQWQQSVLQDGFEIERSVGMGFYPRLEWPVSMQQHQMYRNLPVVEAAIKPEIVDDGLVDGFPLGNDSGRIVIKMENSKGLPIEDFSIIGLEVTSILSQEFAEDGLYEVVLQVRVAPGIDGAYLSSYEIESFTYNNSGASATEETDYMTRSIKFYKEISSTTEWTLMNDNMKWNYRITADLDFTKDPQLLAATIINGSKTNRTTRTIFSGSLDGGKYDVDGNLIGMHTVKGLSVEGSEIGYIFYNLTNNAKMTNIIYDDVTIVATSAQSYENAGLIGSMSRYGTIENVHMTNSNIKASGNLGGLVGLSYGHIENSSVSDTTITLASSKFTVRAGGIAGYLSASGVLNSYTRNVTMDIMNVNNSGGIGGIAGYGAVSSIISSYSHGSITTDASLVGGIVGRITSNASGVMKSFSYVTINSSSVNVGGLIGSSEAIVRDSLAIGDVFAGAANTHRLIGFDTYGTHYIYNIFGYKGQITNALTENDNDDANYLFSADELRLPSTYLNTIYMGRQFNYDSLSSSQLPMLYKSGTNELLYGQQGNGIAIPGNSPLTVSVLQAQVDNSSTRPYQVALEIGYEGKTYEELAVMLGDTNLDGYIDNNNPSLTFLIEGMSMTEADFADGKYHYVIQKHPVNDSVQLVIETSTALNAFDTYKFKLTEGLTVITAVIDYGESIFKEISNLTEWNDYMADHSRLTENIMISGMIDFKNEPVLYHNILVGKMVGKETGSDVGFKNLSFATSSATGGTWITSASSLDNLLFKDITVTSLQTPVFQSASELFTNVSGDISRIRIDGFTGQFHSSYSGATGFIGLLLGNMTDVTVNNVKITDLGSVNRDEAIGAIVGYTYGGFKNISGKNITIEAKDSYNVGGLIGYVNGVYPEEYTPSENATLENITVKGKYYAGGFIGNALNINGMSNVSIKNADVTADSKTVAINPSAGGLFGRLYNIAGNSSNISADNVKVTSIAAHATVRPYAGGIAGTDYYNDTISNLKVTNSNIFGENAVGGITGYSLSTNYIGVTIENTDIVQYTDSESMPTDLMGAAGVIGHLTGNYYQRDIMVRDTRVSADNNAGGVIGSTHAENESSRVLVGNIYIAEDVTITATNENAGGIVGVTTRYTITDAAIGANVIALNSNAGGVIGNVRKEVDDAAYQTLKGIYIRGTVSADTKAAGVIGTSGNDVILETNNIDGIIIAADLESDENFNLIMNTQNISGITSGNVSILDSLLINGRDVNDVVDSADLTVGTFVGASEFSDPSFYTAHKFDDISTANLSVSGNAYMPFITNNDGVIHAGSNVYNGKNVGILLPQDGARNKETVVYTSGVDSVNIETIHNTITIDGAEHILDESYKIGDYYVITYGYDFKPTSSIEVEGITYTTKDLAFTVMTNNVTYYFEQDGLLKFGGLATVVPQIVQYNGSNLSKPLHMWQGDVVCEDGIVYTLDAGTVVPKDSATLLAPKEIAAESRPLFEYISGLRTYYYVSDYIELGESERLVVNYRLLQLYGNDYPVFTSQNAEYGTYLLSEYGDERYFALMDQDTKQFTNYFSNLTVGKFRLTGINHTSNNFNFPYPIMVARYDDGSVAVWNYADGIVLYDSTPQPDITTFAMDFLGGLMNPLFGSKIISDTSYVNSLEALNEYYDENGISVENAGSLLVNSNSLALNGDSTGTNEVLASLPDSASYSTENGLYANGNALEVNGDVVYVENEGVYVDNKLVYKETKTQSEDSTEGESTTSVSLEKVESDVKPILSDFTIVMNPYTGKYEIAKTEDALERKEYIESNEDVVLYEDSDVNTEEKDPFSIGNIFTAVFNSQDQNGIVILASLGFVAVAIFAMMYLKLRKTK